MTCLRTLREAARLEVKPDVRYTLQAAAALLAEKTAAFVEDQTVENMIDLNGAWAYCQRVLKLATPQVDPNPPRSGSGQLPAYLEERRRVA